MSIRRFTLAAVLALLSLQAAAAAQPFEQVPAPAGDGAAEPFLFATNDAVLLSWLEPVAGTDRTSLRFSKYRNGAWSRPSTVVERNDLFVNWADFPSIVEDGSGTLYAHWLQKSGKGKYAYDVRMSVSRDGGASWSPSFLLNTDRKEAEHGFVSLVPLKKGVAATWLDGRNMKPGEHEHGGGDMSLRFANVSAAGRLSAETQLDARTCECCTTGMALGAGGPVIVYRDRSEDETRDISVVRRTSAGWTRPRPVNTDGWKIEGCPVNGPQIDAAGKHLVAAWFTAAGERQRVNVAFSRDGGSTFAKPVAADDGKPVGRVDVVMLSPASAAVAWLEQTSSGAEIRIRRVGSDGSAGPSSKVADSSTSRAAGFVRMARSGGDVWLAWTEQGQGGKRVRVARARMK